MLGEEQEVSPLWFETIWIKSWHIQLYKLWTAQLESAFHRDSEQLTCGLQNHYDALD